MFINPGIYLLSFFSQEKIKSLRLDLLDAWLFGLWCFLYLPTIWSVGFFSDDFTAAQNILNGKVGFFETLLSDRPLGALIFMPIAMLFRMDPVALQVVSKIFFLVAAFCFSRLVRLVLLFNSSQDRAARMGAFAATAIYISNPWNHALFVTATFYSFTFAISCLSLGLATFIFPEVFRRSRFYPFALFLVPFLTYQAFWFAFIPFFFILLIDRVRIGQGFQFFRAGLSNFVAASGAQAIAIFLTGVFFWYNTVAVRKISLTGSSGKQINMNFLTAFQERIGNLYNILFDPFVTPFFSFVREHSSFNQTDINHLIVWPFALALILVAKYSYREFFPMLVKVGLCLLGLLGSISIFVLANYDISVSGYFSRTAIMISFWISISAGLLAHLVFKNKNRVAHWMTYLSVLTIVVAFTIQNKIETAKLIKMDQAQEVVLGHVPENKLLELPAGSLVLVVFPDQFEAMDSLGSAWALSGAVGVRYPKLQGHFEQYWFMAPARFDEWLTTFDGQTVTQKLCRDQQVKTWIGQATSIAIWEVRTGSVRSSDGIQWGCPKRKD